MTAHAVEGLLRAEGLVKRYGSRSVVRDMTLQVRTGEIVGLLGPNGAGKTTSFYMMTGLVKPDGGQIWLDGRDISRLPLHSRARLGVGYLPQEPSVFRKLSVEDNLLAVLELRPDLRRASDRQKICDGLLEELHITHVRQSLGLSLSGGERRRVEIARALAAEPRFLLLDEPFAGVDPISVLDIQRLIRHLAERGIGVLITDHNVRETLRICSHATIMHAGHVLAEGTAEAILADPRVREVYLGEQFSL
ncbi:MAG: LPS export ABC transporter ATP-binding protein [Pseudomonadota bacterium]